MTLTPSSGPGRSTTRDTSHEPSSSRAQSSTRYASGSSMSTSRTPSSRMYFGDRSSSSSRAPSSHASSSTRTSRSNSLVPSSYVSSSTRTGRSNSLTQSTREPSTTRTGRNSSRAPVGVGSSSITRGASSSRALVTTRASSTTRALSTTRAPSTTRNTHGSSSTQLSRADRYYETPCFPRGAANRAEADIWVRNLVDEGVGHLSFIRGPDGFRLTRDGAHGLLYSTPPNCYEPAPGYVPWTSLQEEMERVKELREGLDHNDPPVDFPATVHLPTERTLGRHEARTLVENARARANNVYIDGVLYRRGDIADFWFFMPYDGNDRDLHLAPLGVLFNGEELRRSRRADDWFFRPQPVAGNEHTSSSCTRHAPSRASLSRLPPRVPGPGDTLPARSRTHGTSDRTSSSHRGGSQASSRHAPSQASRTDASRHTSGPLALTRSRATSVSGRHGSSRAPSVSGRSMGTLRPDDGASIGRSRR